MHVHVCVPEVSPSPCGQCCPAGVCVALGTYTATPTPVTQAQEDGAGARPGTVVSGHGALQWCPARGFATATAQQLAHTGCGMHVHTHTPISHRDHTGGRWGPAPRPPALAVATLPAHPQCLGRMRRLGAPPRKCLAVPPRRAVRAPWVPSHPAWAWHAGSKEPFGEVAPRRAALPPPVVPKAGQGLLVPPRPGEDGEVRAEPPCAKGKEPFLSLPPCWEAGRMEKRRRTPGRRGAAACLAIS